MNNAPSRLEESLRRWMAEAGSSAAAEAVLAAAEDLLTEGPPAPEGRETWFQYLNETRRPGFLLALPHQEARSRWAETTFPLIRHLGFGFEELILQRVAEHPHRTYFREIEGGESRDWSYETIHRRLRTIASVFWSTHTAPPRVAIISENNLDGACCDLACLTYDILVAPLNPHFNAENLGWIFDTLEINTVVVETDEMRSRMENLRSTVRKPFHLFILDPEATVRGEAESLLGEAMAQLGPHETDEILSRRPRRGIMELATVMFTSGSTGRPKGVQYTLYNLITKRFARAAALPKVGDEEVLFCFLPLYHTFGRYLEMTGMLFWGGTYVFAGNPSIETLLAGLGDVRPTGLVSIPRRWQQIKDRCLEEMGSSGEKSARSDAFRRIVGDRLRWGLSAAGALEPAAFHFFERHGVELCSGFGMTEATGGITMTPPGEYEDNTVGIPLPGLEARLSEEGELQISGHYLARYLGDPVPSPDDDYWLQTGDIFRQRESGHYEIVDRIKDIYKNSKGQTVAPGAIEQKLAHVPGIARSFVVGDGRDYNVLLIVPDKEDPVLVEGLHSEKTAEYFKQIISTANHDLAPYERVVNFRVLDRDFDGERGELTPKGSFNRKTIRENFSEVIEELYRRDFVELELGRLRVRIPRWFFRDLGILEPDIVAQADGLLNSRAQRFLPIAPNPASNSVRIGDLEYVLEGDKLDLGLFARQPMLWLGNPSLIAFCPCKEGWDLPLKRVSSQILLPWRKEGEYAPTGTVTPTSIRDGALIETNRLCTVALFAPTPTALEAVQELEEFLKESSLRLTRVIHRRLEALARHPDLAVRTLAYKIFLLVGPVPDYTREMASFLLSGLPFLSEESIESIAHAKIERARLDALRLRLQKYRTQLTWPAADSMREQLEGIFALLSTFVRHHPDYYVPVRAELASWILLEGDPEVSECARGYMDRMVQWFGEYLEETTPNNEPSRWDGRIVFQDQITEEEIKRIKKALVGTTFLKQSVMLAYEARGVEIDEIRPNGIWIARVFSFLKAQVYRMSVNTTGGRHYDLLLATASDTEEASVLESTYWMLALGGRVDSRPVVRQFGCYRPELGAFTMALVNDLTVWERVRELTSESFVEFLPRKSHWRNLFVRGMAAFFYGWEQSDRRLVPGPVSPSNVVVPAPDFRAGGTILSLADWRPYSGPMSLARPMLKNFFLPAISYYPLTRETLEISWLFDAAVEALGAQEAVPFLTELRESLATEPVPELDPEWRISEELDSFLTRLRREYRVPLPLLCAVERYLEWESSNPRATPQAKERQIKELHSLYRLDAYGDMGRYTLYRRTYFSRAAVSVTSAFDRLLEKMFRNPGQRPTHMVELSDLQGALESDADRLVFSRLVFPSGRSIKPVDVRAVGDQERGYVVVTSHIRDRRGDSYTVREPIDPAEIGRLFRLYLDSGMPLSLGDQARYLMAIDGEERIVGGICYKLLEPSVAHMDGLVISPDLRGHGLGGELLEDFSNRLQSQGALALNTHFISRPFLRAHDFQVDERWGGLVRFLESGSEGGER
jgi:long-subunit acyl-CoA synthetase (AMP-forming)/GNAT superfamily N-acetyltransferase